MHRLTVLPLLLVIALYALVGPSAIMAAIMAILLLTTVLVPWRMKLSRPAQVVLSITLIALTMTVITTVFPSSRQALMQLRVGWSAFAGGVLSLAIMRMWTAEPAGRDALTLGLGLIGLTACGGARTGYIFPAAVGAFLVLAFVARRYSDEGYAPIRRVLRGGLVPIFIMGVVTAGTALTIVETLPLMHTWAMQRFRLYTSSRSGFSDSMWLGSMRGMLMSDRKVMRIRGDDVDHLRGIVYTRYAAGRWARGAEQVMSPISPPTTAPAGAVEIEIIDSEPRRYFLPLAASQISVSTGIARVDRMGVVAPIAADPADRIWYHPEGERTYAVSSPSAMDVQVPPAIRLALEPLARAWSASANTAAGKLDLLSSTLQTNYSYSLEFERSHRNDPIVEFLEAGGRGHCEYFASAMALLSRSIGIPARVVGGYRVYERNELGGYWIVRERNAHTWVEAWVDGHWQTYDPTPASELFASMRAETPFFGAMVDLVGTAWAAFVSWLDRRTWTEMLGAPALLLLLPFALRWWRNRRRSAKKRGRTVDLALPCFEDLTAALERRGIVRAASETVNQLAARLMQSATLPSELAKRSAATLRRYAALRYGNIGDEAELSREVAVLCREI